MKELVQKLVAELGIGEEQAKGGAGLLFKLAKDNLKKKEFAQIADNVPGINKLIKAAPQSGGGDSGSGGGLLGGMTSMLGNESGASGLGSMASSVLGDKAGALGNIAGLAGGFSALKLDSAMIAKFAPIVLSYVQEHAGDKAKGLMSKVLNLGG